MSARHLILCCTPEGCTCGAPASTPAGMHHCDCDVHPGWCGEPSCLPCEQNGKVGRPMSAPNRAPTTAWFMRRLTDPGRYPNGYVVTIEGDEVKVVYFQRADYPQSMILSRRDARLIAKRINECLDATVKP